MLLFALVAGASTEDPASQWPRFRGPNGTGLSDANIPTKWSDANYKWKIELPGGGNGSPAVWGDRIFLTCGNDRTGEHSVVCVNAKDGSIRWTRSYPAETYSHHQYNSYASSTPAVDAKHVFVCWSTPEELSVIALDHDGKDLWQRGLGPFESQHGGGQSPIAYDGMAILADDQEGPASFLFALNGDTGAEMWKISRKPSNKFAAATPCVFQPKDGPAELIFMNKSRALPRSIRRMGTRSGRCCPRILMLDRSHRPTRSTACSSAPAATARAGIALPPFVPSDDGKSAEIAYDFRKASPYVPTSIVKNGLLFYVTDYGILACLHAESAPTDLAATPRQQLLRLFVCAGDKLFILSKGKERNIVIAAKDTFELLARNPLKLEAAGAKIPPLSTTPAIANGRMYVRTYTHLVCIGS